MIRSRLMRSLLGLFVFAATESPNAAEHDAAPSDAVSADEAGKFLPLPLFITEPAIGEGLGATLIYFHGEDRREGLKVSTAREVSRTTRRSKPPPTATGIFGAYTNNDTAAVGIGHSNSFMQDRYRLLAATADARINSSFFIADSAFGFTLDGSLLYANLKRRLGDSSAFVGFTSSYADAGVNFKTDLGDFNDVSLVDFDFVDVGFALSLIYDSRDNTLMPARGYIVDLTNWHYDEAIGGDFNYRKLTFKTNSYFALDSKHVLGLRFDFGASDGNPPFFAEPYVKLRGIPALRYQGETAGAAEIELRRRIDDRWSASLFGGVGSVDVSIKENETKDNIRTIGFGVRYLAVREQDAWVGLDVARGPEDTAWYIQMGNAW